MTEKPYVGNPYFMKENTYFAQEDVIVEKSHTFDERPHTHNFIELVYTFKGKLTHIIDDVEYPTSKGDLIIINYGQVHNFFGSKDSIYYNFLIKPEYINESVAPNKDFFALLELNDYTDFKELVNKNSPQISFSPNERITFEHILIMLDNEIENKNIGYQTLTHSAVNILLTMIFRKMSITYTNAENILKEVLAYIKDNFSESISESKIAAIWHYNPSYFSRMFKSHTGATFTEYLKKTRINAACNLLINTDTKINDLYIKVGYTDKTKFHKHFRELTGVTPLSYRKSKR